MNDQRSLFDLMSRAGISLLVFAAAGVGIVTLIHFLTAERIEKNEREYLLRSLNDLIPQALYDNDFFSDTIQVINGESLGTEKPVSVYRARRNDEPVGLIIAPEVPNGYNGTIRLLVGIHADGSLAGIRVVSHRETPGLGDGIDQRRSGWYMQFPGLSLENVRASDWRVKKDGGQFDQLTGATISPRVVVEAVHKTILFVTTHRQRLYMAPAGQIFELETGEPS